MAVQTPVIGGGGGGITPGLLVNQFFHRITAPNTTVIAPERPIGSIVIVVADTTGFVDGDKLAFNGIVSSQFIPITDGASGANNLLIRYPLDIIAGIGQTVERVETDITSLAGTGASDPVLYKAQPFGTEKWRIAELLVTMTYSVIGFDGDFGDIQGGLAGFGMVIRVSIGGTIITLMEWLTNEDILRDSFDFKYSDTRGPNGTEFGLNARFDFARLTANSILDGSTGDFIEVFMADNVTTLLNFQISAQGQIIP